MSPPRSVYLTALFSRLRERLRQPREVGVEPTAACPAVPIRTTCPAASMSGCDRFEALRTIAARSIRSRRSSIRLRVMRDTSSSSSVRSAPAAGAAAP